MERDLHSEGSKWSWKARMVRSQKPPRPRRLTVRDPVVAKLLGMLGQSTQNGIYVLVIHEGRVVQVYRTVLDESLDGDKLP